MIILSGCTGSTGHVPLHVDSPGGFGVLPFEDRSGSTDATLGSQVAHQFASRLAAGAFDVIDPRQIDALFAEAGMELPDRFDARAREMIRTVTGCDMVVTGVITDVVPGDGFNAPKAVISIRLVDLESGYTVYSLGRSYPGGVGNRLGGDTDRLVLDCADYLADRMSLDVARREGSDE